MAKISNNVKHIVQRGGVAKGEPPRILIQKGKQAEGNKERKIIILQQDKIHTSASSSSGSLLSEKNCDN